MRNFNKVAILGPGVLGGSIGLALRARHPKAQIAIWARRAEAAERARSVGACDFASSDLKPVVEGASLIVLCTPIGAMAELASTIAPYLQEDAIVTDVGSVKGRVLAEVAPALGERGRFIGSHPMAGSEQTGLGAARADLFVDAPCLITPVPESDPAALAAVAAFWELLGAVPQEISPAEHDRAVALISHLPHAIAAALMKYLSENAAGALQLSGGGLRDTTRVAAGPPEMWAEILLSNQANLRPCLAGFIEKLQELATLLDAHDPTAMNAFLATAKSARDQLTR